MAGKENGADKISRARSGPRENSAAAAGAAAAAATAGRGGSAGRATAETDRGQQLHRVVVALRAGRRLAGLAHRPGQQERVAAGAAAELIAWHAAILPGPAGSCTNALA